MNIVLHYRGLLKANGNAAHKQQIRAHFHKQLQALWQQPPLDQLRVAAFYPTRSDPGHDYKTLMLLAQGIQMPSLVVAVGNIQFVPLVSTKLNAVAELDITLLRPEPAGRILASGGDIDNRIKTLLDALKIPDANQVKAVTDSQTVDQPFLCLLEDDGLVVRLSVLTEQLLEPVKNNSEVIALIRVSITRVAESMHNSFLV
jgi:hypothetical protein